MVKHIATNRKQIIDLQVSFFCLQRFQGVTYVSFQIIRLSLNRWREKIINWTYGPSIKYAKFSEKQTFLTPWYVQVCVRIRGLEMLVFRKMLRTYLMDDHLCKWCLDIQDLCYFNLEILLLLLLKRKYR